MWFTYGNGQGFAVSRPIEPQVLFDWIRQAYDRGAANVLLSLAADHTGKMRPDDVKQLEELGKMLSKAGLLEVPKAAVQPVVSLAIGRPAKTSGTWENNIPQYGAAMAFDGDASTRWAGPVGDARPAGWRWISARHRRVPLPSSRKAGTGPASSRCNTKSADEWKDAAEGTTIGAERELEFAPVKARVFRLNITDATDVPTIWEFQLFGENSPRTKMPERR